MKGYNVSDDERRGAAFILGVVSYLEKKLKAEKATLTTQLALKAGERIAIETPGGVTIGFIGMQAGRRGVFVYDWDALAKWLKPRFEGSVKMTVDPAWWKINKEHILKRGALIDLNGEVCEHVTVEQGNPFVATTLDDKVGASEILDRMFKSRALTFNPTAVKSIAARAVTRKKAAK